MKSSLKIQEHEEIEELEPLEPAEKKSRRLPPLLRLNRRTVIFLSFTLTASIIFFMTGNQQSFLDSNLRLILKIITSNAIALVFFSGTAIAECIFYTFKEKKFRLIFHFIIYLLIFSASIFISIFSLTINLLSEGIDF
ncbi:MAG: hypothetical protein II821_07805 [Treponema sp.]|nr:hypothetical protein [Treponema sp.]